MKILAEATIAATSTPIPTETATPTPKATSTPTPTPVLQPRYSSEEINGFINRFSGQYGVSPDVMRHIAICESGFNQQAYNAGYAGLFQFGPTTWKNLRIKIEENVNADLRYNAEEAAQTAAYALSIGDTSIWPNCQP